jgi:hypothetical protein
LGLRRSCSSIVTLRTKAVREATASERSIHWTDRARGNEPARIPLWFRGQYEVGLTKNPATNQRDAPLAGLFGLPALARHRRVRGVTLTLLTKSRGGRSIPLPHPCGNLRANQVSSITRDTTPLGLCCALGVGDCGASRSCRQNSWRFADQSRHSYAQAHLKEESVL